MVTTTPSRRVTFSSVEFDAAFPFHVAFDRAGRITSLGHSLRKLSPGLAVGDEIARAFAVQRPEGTLHPAEIAPGDRRLYVIREAATGVVLRGQMQVLEGEIFFLGSPWLADTAELPRLALTLSDFAVHDPTLDLLQVLQLQKIATDDLQRLTARLRDQRTQLEEAGRMKDAFLASVSHELRTPLTGIIGLSESMRAESGGPVTPTQARYLQTIATSGRRLLGVVNDILDLSKLQAGNEQLARQCCPVEPICQASLETVQPLVEKRKHTLHFSSELGATHATIDARRVKRALDNLLENAAKFTPPGGQLGLRAAATERELRLEVWDRGIGIAPEDQARLFKPFVQLDHRLARRFDGTGLGLALVKLLAERHGGRVELQSTPGFGSSFTLVLPRDGGA